MTLRRVSLASFVALAAFAMGTACSRPAQEANPVPAERAPIERAPAPAPVETPAPISIDVVATDAPATDPSAAPAPAAAPSPADEVIILETAVGNITIDVFEDKAPLHAANFKKQVLAGYYDGSPFHRVIEGFMAQGGGKWGPGNQPVDAGHTVPAEIITGLTHHRGAVAGARLPDQVNPKRESSGSQFYICYGNTPWLDGQYSIFGEVVAGMENVDKITKGPQSRNGAVDPAQATVITKARIEAKK